LKQILREAIAAVRQANPKVTVVVPNDWILRDGKNKLYAGTAHTDYNPWAAKNDMRYVRKEGKLWLILEDAVDCAKRGQPEQAVDVGLSEKMVVFLQKKDGGVEPNVQKIFDMINKSSSEVYYGVWQNVHEKKQPILNKHLAFLLPNTLKGVNLRPIRNKKGRITKYQLWKSMDAKHSWVYFPRMDMDEAIVWTHSDDRKYKTDPSVGGAVFHAAIDTADAWKDKSILQDMRPQDYVRQSVEHRLVGFFL